MTSKTSSSLRLLAVSNMWPSDAHPVFGVFVERNAEALKACGASVDVVANTDARSGSVWSALKYTRLARRVRKHVLGRRYDAVIGHYLYPTAAIAHMASRFSGARLVLVVHGTDALSIRRKDPFAALARKALNTADLVITVSNALAHTVRQDLGLPGHIPVATVHMGIEERVFAPDPSARAILGIPRKEKVVLYVGNLTKTKGLDVLQVAFENLVASGKVDRLVIVGDGPLRSKLHDWQSGTSWLRQRVTMTGVVSHVEVARWMASSDVLVLPSRSEGLGLVLLEAMACGTPCVASRVGGIPEVLTEQTGALVPPDDSVALASALADVIKRGRDSYFQACVDTAREHGSYRKAKEMLEAIEAVCESTF